VSSREGIEARGIIYLIYLSNLGWFRGEPAGEMGFTEGNPLVVGKSGEKPLVIWNILLHSGGEWKVVEPSGKKWKSVGQTG